MAESTNSIFVLNRSMWDEWSSYLALSLSLLPVHVSAALLLRSKVCILGAL